MNLSNFLNPGDGNIEVEEAMLMVIIAAYTMPQQKNQEQEEHENEEVFEPLATINQALNSLKFLLRFKEHDLDANSIELTILMRMERSLQQQAEINRSQGILDSWFKKYMR
ncbi:unnamed protein product [Blumeria hordei]|uniref:Uncharacterized protein n=1 Tax=Blumeria hordei TaxID=2867405 RepID=A0A383UJR2_BLUHO|nr:unnamed protein product [Blumeria hordei]